MTVYRFHEVTLEVEPPALEARTGVGQVCSALSWSPAADRHSDGQRLSLSLHDHGRRVPPAAQLRHEAEGLRVFEDAASCYVSDGASLLHFDADQHNADAYLDTSFYQKPPSLQWRVWSFCILKLLRPLGYFCLHAAGVVSPNGQGMLIIGPSGSGKSTLAVGLIGSGWKFLSDDAVLLCRRGTTISALSLRHAFYIATANVWIGTSSQAGPGSQG